MRNELKRAFLKTTIDRGLIIVVVMGGWLVFSIGNYINMSIDFSKVIIAVAVSLITVITFIVMTKRLNNDLQLVFERFPELEIERFSLEEADYWNKDLNIIIHRGYLIGCMQYEMIDLLNSKYIYYHGVRKGGTHFVFVDTDGEKHLVKIKDIYSNRLARWQAFFDYLDKTYGIKNIDAPN